MNSTLKSLRRSKTNGIGRNPRAIRNPRARQPQSPESRVLSQNNGQLTIQVSPMAPVSAGHGHGISLDPRSLKRPVTTIAVVGLGYVGLPLSLQFARSGLNVIGLDID